MRINITAKSIGNGLALLQSKVDDLFDFGFKKLSKATKKELPKETNKVKKAGYKLGGFIGNVGKSYYKKYNEIKEEQAKK
ncbi:hypothetical protein A9Q91_03865 [Candidatus Gracilibacteria bacterium 28_42_T64]|nr:hypothetical protein A9Q91_03865 [Candidatus Gracilibacteria bacterium 28_42_T64]